MRHDPRAARRALAFDWAWEKGTERDQRDFRIVQSSPTIFFPEINDAPLPAWAVEFGVGPDGHAASSSGTTSSSPSRPTRARPPAGTRTRRYWGRNLDERGITCWMPLHDVDERNGCMHFIDGGHRDGVLEHHQAPGVQSDLLCCEPDESRAVACPIPLGSVTFHHGKTPHMTPANADRRVAPHPHPAPAGRGHPGRGRPLPVEGLRQPVHRRAYDASGAVIDPP